MKLQALADFITEPQSRVKIISTSEDRTCTLFTDGSSISQVEGACVIFTSLEGFVIKQVVKCTFPTTNNEAEYEGLIAGLKPARHLEVLVIDIFSDSQLALKQALGKFKTINEKLAAYMQVTSKLLQTLTSWTINNIDRSVNQCVDALSNLAT